ncbi:hypothetical protein GDO86_001811 [Hymenochirus boettgeri]|uniref:G-protein coupled receptors family 1 profile domain-containing protein n=1 Tax=Hymenochirus boettgeri TaxID=247094 RepID=A0A8T2KFA2_9PIPI|nr:hypothetical protein GDO86_001811 [Hymenochirus boettgeri]
MNNSEVTEFILLGFSLAEENRACLFSFFLLLYISTIVANVFIIVLVYKDHHLYKPMYILISSFSFLEICYTAVTVPKMLSDLSHPNRCTISVVGCITQYNFFSLCAAMEHFILVAMAFDRYVAICYPLQYGSIMNNKTCIQLVIVSWIISCCSLSIPAFSVSKLYFCGPNVIDHFFCEFNHMLKLSCTDTFIVQTIFSFLSWLIIGGCLICIGISYGFIIFTVLKIPSRSGKWKAFSTCASHLTVVGIFYGTVIFIYLRPTERLNFHENKVVSVFYIIVTPVLNPIIYSFKNQLLRDAASNLFCRIRTQYF